ncbi:unnamed protein product [Amoebophrya sp. A120]|nr:unnamed protein product [Amoebophrya sp. A120]|eukprot:GSA120T00004059001.1
MIFPDSSGPQQDVERAAEREANMLLQHRGAKTSLRASSSGHQATKITLGKKGIATEASPKPLRKLVRRATSSKFDEVDENENRDATMNVDVDSQEELFLRDQEGATASVAVRESARTRAKSLLRGYRSKEKEHHDNQKGDVSVSKETTSTGSAPAGLRGRDGQARPRSPQKLNQAKANQLLGSRRRDDTEDRDLDESTALDSQGDVVQQRHSNSDESEAADTSRDYGMFDQDDEEQEEQEESADFVRDQNDDDEYRFSEEEDDKQNSSPSGEAEAEQQKIMEQPGTDEMTDAPTPDEDSSDEDGIIDYPIVAEKKAGSSVEQELLPGDVGSASSKTTSTASSHGSDQDFDADSRRSSISAAQKQKQNQNDTRDDTEKSTADLESGFVSQPASSASLDAETSRHAESAGALFGHTGRTLIERTKNASSANNTSNFSNATSVSASPAKVALGSLPGGTRLMRSLVYHTIWNASTSTSASAHFYSDDKCKITNDKMTPAVEAHALHECATHRLDMATPVFFSMKVNFCGGTRLDFQLWRGPGCGLLVGAGSAQVSANPVSPPPDVTFHNERLAKQHCIPISEQLYVRFDCDSAGDEEKQLPASIANSRLVSWRSKTKFVEAQAFHAHLFYCVDQKTLKYCYQGKRPMLDFDLSDEKNDVFTKNSALLITKTNEVLTRLQVCPGMLPTFDVGSNSSTSTGGYSSSVVEYPYRMGVSPTETQKKCPVIDSTAANTLQFQGWTLKPEGVVRYPSEVAYKDPTTCDLKVSLYSSKYLLDTNDQLVGRGEVSVAANGFLQDARRVTMTDPAALKYKFILQPNHRYSTDTSASANIRNENDNLYWIVRVACVRPPDGVFDEDGDEAQDKLHWSEYYGCGNYLCLDQSAPGESASTETTKLGATRISASTGQVPTIVNDFLGMHTCTSKLNAAKFVILPHDIAVISKLYQNEMQRIRCLDPTSLPPQYAISPLANMTSLEEIFSSDAAHSSNAAKHSYNNQVGSALVSWLTIFLYVGMIVFLFVWFLWFTFKHEHHHMYERKHIREPTAMPFLPHLQQDVLGGNDDSSSDSDESVFDAGLADESDSGDDDDDGGGADRPAGDSKNEKRSTRTTSEEKEDRAKSQNSNSSSASAPKSTWCPSVRSSTKKKSVSAEGELTVAEVEEGDDYDGKFAKGNSKKSNSKASAAYLASQKKMTGKDHIDHPSDEEPEGPVHRIPVSSQVSADFAPEDAPKNHYVAPHGLLKPKPPPLSSFPSRSAAQAEATDRIRSLADLKAKETREQAKANPREALYPHVAGTGDGRRKEGVDGARYVLKGGMDEKWEELTGLQTQGWGESAVPFERVPSHQSVLLNNMNPNNVEEKELTHLEKAEKHYNSGGQIRKAMLERKKHDAHKMEYSEKELRNDVENASVNNIITVHENVDTQHGGEYDKLPWFF